MPIVETHKLAPKSLSAGDNLQAYCGLDCMITFEVLEELEKLFNRPPEVYDFKLALQAPALEMMLRGFKIDGMERRNGIELLSQQIAELEETLNSFAQAYCGRNLNARSHDQCKKFFYETLKLPEVWISQKGVRKLSINREALEKLEVYFHAQIIVACILAIRDLSKRRSVLETEVDADGRMRTSYNIAGTESERWSSSANAFGTGTNLQNITPELRKMFISDPGWKLCGIDLEQAESREVGFLFGSLFGDWSFLDACEGGDLHTTTARLIWPDLITDRKSAEQPFYRHMSYRDMAKRGGHLTSYMGTAWTASRSLKVPLPIMERFQNAFVSAYPSFPRWWRHCAQCLQTEQRITTPFGNTRIFFGRANDDSTLREAIAHSPQSATALRLNLALYRVWKRLGTRVQLIAQVHDALYFQYRESDDEVEVLQEALACISTPMVEPRSGRVFDVPGEAKLGWNWGSFGPANPDGLAKFKGKADTRTRTTALSRVM